MSSLCEGNGSRDCFLDGLTPKKGISLKIQIMKQWLTMTFDFLEGDVKKSIVDGIPPIDFSERIHRQLIKDLKIIVILKLM
ncbi:hypothetical protein Golob_007731, partial [Gossypium lobatum]|nr:hypothetical protein [Gossypium lobatum]